MSAYVGKAAIIRAPFGDGTNSTRVRFYTCDSTSKANSLPDAWADQYILITNEGTVTAQFFISKLSTASCDETLAATDAGLASASLGGGITAGQSRHVLLPARDANETLYLVRASTSSCPLRVELT